MTRLRLIFAFFRRNRGANLLNLVGLIVGLTAVLLIGLYVHHEWSTDRHLPHADRLMRVDVTFRVGDTAPVRLASAATSVAPVVARKVPGIESWVRLRNYGGEIKVLQDDRTMVANASAFADSTLFRLFGLPLLRGDAASALTRPNTVVLSERFAREYFGQEDPVGRQLELESGDAFEVTGVYRPSEKPSQLPAYDLIFSYSSMEFDDESSFLNQNFLVTWFLLAPGVQPEDLYPAIDRLVEERHGEDLAAVGGMYRIRMQPVTDAYFDTDFKFMQIPGGSWQSVQLLAAIGLFILVVAVLNYINLATAVGGMRAKQVGVSKTLGATRPQLVRQFLLESLVMSVIAVTVAVVGVELALPYFAGLAGMELNQPLGSPRFLALLAGLALVVGAGAGVYPALFLSSYAPVTALRGQGSSGRRGRGLRSVLVVVQFTLSVILIVGALVVYNQLQYTRTKDLGFDRERLVVIDLRAERLWNDAGAMLEQVRKVPGVASAAATRTIPGFNGGDRSFRVPGASGEEAHFWTRTMQVGPELMQTMGVKLVQGRYFDESRPTDMSHGIMVNETTLRELGWTDDPLDHSLEMYVAKDQLETLPVIGVLEDFHYQSLHSMIEPLVVMAIPERREPLMLVVRLEAGRIQEAMRGLEGVWAGFAPEAPLDYEFFDAVFDRMYRQEQRLGQLVLMFTVLAVLIASLGLFALASFAAQRRTKEIGVRKVLGASVPGVVGLLVRDFLALVLVANVIAWPVAWFIGREWLENFAYRIELGPGLFLAATLLSMLVALVTVAGQALRAANTNPVKALRYE